jgi:hypothetical protein
MEMLAFVVATLLFGGLVVGAIRLWLTGVSRLAKAALIEKLRTA